LNINLCESKSQLPERQFYITGVKKQDKK